MCYFDERQYNWKMIDDSRYICKDWRRNLYVREYNSKFYGGYRKSWGIYDSMVGMVHFLLRDLETRGCGGDGRLAPRPWTGT